MLDESDYLSPSVDQGPSCLIIVLCPQLKLSVGRRSVWLPGAGRERSGSLAAAPLAATRRRCRAVPADPEPARLWGRGAAGASHRSAAAIPPRAAVLGLGWGLPPRGPQPPLRSFRRRPPFPGRGAPLHLLEEAASRKAGRRGPGVQVALEAGRLAASPLSPSGKDAQKKSLEGAQTLTGKNTN